MTRDGRRDGHSPTPYDVVALAASAGGLKALSEVLSALPKDFPAAIVVVQHVDPRHRSLMAKILNQRTDLRVKEAVEGDKLEPGAVYTAPPDKHLLVNGDGTIALSSSELVHFVRPSLTVVAVLSPDGHPEGLRWLVRTLAIPQADGGPPATDGGSDDSATTQRSAEDQSVSQRKDELIIAERDARSQAEAELARLRRENEAKDEFLAMVSHELRTPSTVILGAAQLLNDRDLDDEGRTQLLADMREHASRLSRIVADLMVVARAELGQQLSSEPLLLRHIVAEVARTMHQERGTTIKVSADEEAAPVLCDATVIEQVVRNLIDNAIKYGGSGGPVEVRIQTGSADEVLVRVLDRGPGLPVDELDRIFERFYRSNSNSAGARGSGLGLSVCKRLIEAHFGRVWAARRDGGGLEVGFALPVYRGD